MTPEQARSTLREIQLEGRVYSYCSLSALESMGQPSLARLPFTLKVMLESLLRQQLLGVGSPRSVQAVIDWLEHPSEPLEIEFRPARVMMVDASGIPLLADLAAMRDAMAALGADPQRINPAVPVDFVVDHSIAVDHAGSSQAIVKNMALEFQRNAERYAFIRWGAQAFDNIRVIPPGAGICHQVNLEYLADVVCEGECAGHTLLYPDSVLGMDSHTPMINSLGVAGWGVGGLEGASAAMGEPVSLLIASVVGLELTGRPRPGVSATDMVLTITQALRRENLVGAFVEYIGEGVRHLDAADRATIANMTPETGATMGFFPIDEETLAFLRLTGRSPHKVARVQAYAQAQGLWRDHDAPPPHYTRCLQIDLSAIEPCVAGPSRPHQRVPLAGVPAAFAQAWPAPAQDSHPTPAEPRGVEGLRNGDVVIAAITSCTNTSNPASMICAGLLARNAVERGLKVPAWVKRSLSPGSRAVPAYLERAGLLVHLEALGFHVTGLGCMTCIGNSGPLSPQVTQAITHQGLAVAAVLSGNRNFEGRVHPLTQANFLASPALVVAYALAGSVHHDLSCQSLGTDQKGQAVFLSDIWPRDEEVRCVRNEVLTRELFIEKYRQIEEGDTQWQALPTSPGKTFEWESASTYIRRPPFFAALTAVPPPVAALHGARVLAMFGDMLTTDHISPIGAIAAGTPAALYLQSLGVTPAQFQSYGSRRANHDVMRRGTFANIRIQNEMTPEQEGGFTRHTPSGQVMTIFEAAERYREQGVPLVVVAGTEYGAGSSRDWAAKGALLLGVKAVIAESFERIHRSNLVGIGILPLQFTGTDQRKSLGLDGSEEFDLAGIDESMTPGMMLACTLRRANGSTQRIELRLRLDTQREVDYHRHGGILPHALRQRLA